MPFFYESTASFGDRADVLYRRWMVPLVHEELKYDFFEPMCRPEGS
jgi:hypothetical protein